MFEFLLGDARPFVQDADRDRLGYTVHGDTVNLAARFESLNKEPGSRVLVLARTAELAGDAMAFRDRGIVAVRGFHEPLRVYEPKERSSEECGSGAVSGHPR